MAERNRMETIGSRLDATKGVAPGFDFLRIFLALSIVGWHVNAIVTGDLSYNSLPFVWVYGYFTLAAFFGLSGFLIAGSALRLTLKNFLINRGLRIIPALAVEIFLSALILGPIFTSLAMSDYFGSAGTWHYFTNIFGWINYVLPGVFKDHPTDIVNNTLWTVPHEIGCYIIMSALMVTGFVRKPWVVAAGAIAVVAIGLGLAAAGVTEQSTGAAKVLNVLFVGKASRLYVCFILGIFFYLVRHRLPYSWPLFGVSVAVCLGIGALPQPGGTNYPLMNLILAVPMCYITAFIGVTRIWTPEFLRKGDYSYGIYLYGWPLQQMLVALLPDQKSLPLHFLTVVPLVLAFAALSWHFIEKPILALRKRFSFMARVRLAEGEAAAAPAANKPAE
jgi:peptidoglycan/LPS O-acetylase OafA/YrhL